MGVDKKVYLSANEYQRDSWRLAAQVRESGWRPDILVALWRGGAPVGVVVHEFLLVSGWKTRHIAVKCASYTGIGENPGAVVFEGADGFFTALRPGDKILVIDDVFDTGKTAAAVKERLEALGCEMRLATVYWKKANNKTKLSPDYFVRETGGDWLVFPHEIEGLAPAEIAEKDSVLAELLGKFRAE